LLARLGDIARRVKQARSEDSRQDLVQAMQLWWARGERLQTVTVRHEGPIDWWAKRHGNLCSDVVQWASNDFVDRDAEEEKKTPKEQLERDPKLQGFAHGDHTAGVLVGEMALPKLDYYTVELVVTKRFPDAKNLGDCIEDPGHGRPDPPAPRRSQARAAPRDGLQPRRPRGRLQLRALAAHMHRRLEPRQTIPIIGDRRGQVRARRAPEGRRLGRRRPRLAGVGGGDLGA
jgi:hypothetical protein